MHTTYHPLRNKLMIAYLAQNKHKKLIDLGDYEFLVFVETSFSKELNCPIRAHIYFLVRNMKGQHIQLMRLTTSAWPLPSLDPDFKIQNDDFIEILPQKISQLNQSYHKVMKAVLFQVRGQQTDAFKLYLVIQFLDDICIFNLNENIIRQVSPLPSLKGQMYHQKLIVGPNQSCYALYTYENLRYGVVKLILMRNDDDKPYFIKSEQLYEQKAQILSFQIDTEVDSIIEHKMTLLDADGKIKKLSFSEVNKKIVMDEKVELVKQIQNWQLESLSFLKHCLWRQITIDNRTIISPSVDSKNTRKLVLNLNSSLYIPVTDDYAREIRSIKPNKKSVRGLRKKSVKIRELYIFIHTVNYVRKQVAALQSGTNSYFFISTTMGSRKIDMVSKKMQTVCESLYLIGNEIFVKLRERSMVLIFNQNDLMLNRVENLKSLWCLTRFYQNRHQYVVRDEKYLFEFQANGDYDLIRQDFDSMIIQKVQEKVDQVLDLKNYVSVYRNNRRPALDLKGDIYILLFINRKQQSNNESISDLKRTKNDQKSKETLSRFFNRRLKDKDIRNKTRIIAQEFCLMNDGSYEFGPSFTQKLVKNKSFIYIVYDTNDELIPKEQGSSIIFTKDYLCWIANKQIHYVSLQEIESQAKLFSELSLSEKMDHSECGRVHYISIVFDKKFPDRFADYLRINQLFNQNLEVTVRDKNRCNIIQIQLQGVSLMWDLDENEEIDFINSPSDFDADTFVRTGYIHFVQSGGIQMPLGQNACQSLFAVHAPNQERLVLFQLYTILDIFTLKSLEAFLQMGLFLKDIDPNLFTANIMGRTFFSLFYDQHELIQMALQQLLQTELQMVVKHWDEIEQESNSIFIRQLYQTLKLPCKKMGRESEDQRQFSTDSNLTASYSNWEEIVPRDKNQTVFEYALYNDEVLLNLLTQLLLLSNEVKVHNLIATFQDFTQFHTVKINGGLNFYEKAVIRTSNCKRVTALMSGDEEVLFFGGNSTQFSDTYIKQRLEEESAKICTNKKLTLSQFTVFIIELEWLIGNFPAFYGQISKFTDDSIFDQKYIQFLLKQLDFNGKVILQFVIPDVIQTCLLLYYFTFELTKFERPDGYAKGDTWPIIVRITILLLDIYFIFVILGTLIFERNFWFRNLDMKKLIEFQIPMILYICFSVVLEFIIFEHSTQSYKISLQALIQMASILTLIIFFVKIYHGMRLFESTAVYIKMINQTIYDIRYFCLVFFVVVCAFSNAIMIINKYEQNQSQQQEIEYESVIEPDPFNSELFNSWINQYLLSLGDFHYENFSSNKSKGFLWIYFLMATFLSQIIFFNMLIAIMGTTYEDVTSQKEKHTLIMRTKILATYAHFIKLDGNKLKEHRYLYIAVRVRNENQQQGSQSEGFDDVKTITDTLGRLNEIQSEIQDEAQKSQLQMQDTVNELKTKFDDSVQEQSQLIQSIWSQMKESEQNTVQEIKKMKIQISTMQEQFQNASIALDQKLESILKALKK